MATATALEQCSVDQASEIYRLFRVKDVAGTRFASWSASPDLDTLTVAAVADLIAELGALPDRSACPCWKNDFRLGHEGHCCFLRDDRNRRINDGWREEEDICHAPTFDTDAKQYDVLDQNGDVLDSFDSWTLALAYLDSWERGQELGDIRDNNETAGVEL